MSDDVIENVFDEKMQDELDALTAEIIAVRGTNVGKPKQGTGTEKIERWNELISLKAAAETSAGDDDPDDETQEVLPTANPVGLSVTEEAVLRKRLSAFIKAGKMGKDEKPVEPGFRKGITKAQVAEACRIMEQLGMSAEIKEYSAKLVKAAKK